MKISFVTEYDAMDIHNWSGLGFNIAKALENQKAEITYVGNLKAAMNLSDVVKKVFYKGLGKTYLENRSLFTAKQFAKQADELLETQTELVFSPGTLPIALMKNRYPKVFYTDATFAGMVDFYPDFSNLSKETIRIGHYLEQKALDNCVLAIYASDWAAQTALENYSVDPRKIKVVPFGANLNSYRSASAIEKIVESRSKSICKLLFLGVDWKRKGGDLALGVAQELIKMGIDTELHIAGIRKIPIDPIPTFVKNHGFISKSTMEGITIIENLLAESHYLILPSIADCSPLVCNEAGSFGLPTICSDVGGIPAIIRNNVNGKIFPINTDANQYATFIQTNFNDLEKYQRLAYSSFNEFQKRLNWNVSGKVLIGLLENQLNT